MKAVLATAALLFISLSGCGRSPDGTVTTSGHGRYAGVGLYPAGPMWSQIVTAGAKDAAASKLADDEEIIVAIDQTTGEIRQCGNLSGVCVGMNPWMKPLAAGARAPVTVSKHAVGTPTDPSAAAKSP